MKLSLKQSTYVFLPLVIGLIFQAFPILGWDFSHIPGDYGDSRFNMYILENGYQFFTGKVDSFWNAGFMHPEPEVISLSDNLLGTVPIYSIFRIFGFDIFTSFQLWWLFIVIINYFSSFLLFHYLTKNYLAASLGAFIFAFSIALASQLNHVQVHPRFAVPLLLFFLFMWKDLNSPKHFIFALLLLVYQFYCGIYLGFFALFLFIVSTITLFTLNFKGLLLTFKKYRSIGIYLLGAFISMVFMYILFLPYLKRAAISELHTYESIFQSIPTLSSYFSAYPGSPFHSFLEETTKEYVAFWDHWIFPGWMVIISFILVIFLYTKRSLLTSNQKCFLFIGIVFFLFFIRIGESSLYSLVFKIPGFSSMRSMTRIINYHLLFFGFFVVISFSQISVKSKASYYFFSGFILLVVVLDNYLPPSSFIRYPKKEVMLRHNQMIEKFNHLPKGTVVSYEPSEWNDPIEFIHLDVMLATQALQLKTVNGYSGSAAYYFDLFWNHPNEQNRLFYFQRFTKDQIGEIIVIK